MPWPQLEASRIHLERAREREGGSKTGWCTDYWQGGSAWAGCGGGGSQRSQIHPQATQKEQKQRKHRWFPSLIDLKIVKNAVFHLKELIVLRRFLRNTLIKKKNLFTYSKAM